jgi:integrase
VKLADIPPEGDKVVRASKVSNLVRDCSKLDEDARREAVEALLGVGSYDGLQAQASTVLTGMEAPAPERAVAAQVEAWKDQLRAACQSGQMSEGRYDAYCRKIRPFTLFVAVIDAISEETLEEFHAYLSDKMSEGAYSPTTAHEILMTAKQFIRWLAERKRIALPGNIDSRRFRFNHTVVAKFETFTVEEIRSFLAECDGFSERTKLYILLMLNCGHCRMDVAELRQDEVNWLKGTLTRSRRKMREGGGAAVTYVLWPETFALLKKHRAAGDLVLTTDEGNPLVKEWLEDGKYRKYDTIRSAWYRLTAKMGLERNRLGMRHLRKTSASLLGEHPQFKFYTTYFLADSPTGMAACHYVTPNDAEFFEALHWLRGQIMEPLSD